MTSGASEKSEPDGGAVPESMPRVVVTSVVRSTQQGESHGGVYLVDLRSGAAELMLDWDRAAISWAGRGGDRGLRGIAFGDRHVYLAASDEIFCYRSDFSMVRSYRNPYLRHCHEIVVAGGRLYATSTGFDSILELDLETGRFVNGHCIRFAAAPRAVRKLGLWQQTKRLGIRPAPGATTFDPNGDGGPPPGDSTHLNNVFVEDARVFASGAQLGYLVCLEGGVMRRAARIPYGTHNARPYGSGRVLLNHTPSDRICVTDSRGRMLESYPIPTYDPGELENTGIDPRTARQAFGRGLAPLGDDWLVAGSSPATVSLYRRGITGAVRSVRLTRDVRNAIHGLELWPFDGASSTPVTG